MIKYLFSFRIFTAHTFLLFCTKFAIIELAYTI